MKKKAGLVVFIFVLVWMAGCVRQAPGFIGTPTPRFTPTPTPTPKPQLVELPSDTDVDATGKRIINTDAHFMQYLDFQWFRVYEYDGDTFLDGICENSYPEALTGEFEIAFKDAAGVELARAPILSKGPLGVFPPGTTEVYAGINTDMDIQLLPFEIIIKQRVWPPVTMQIVE